MKQSRIRVLCLHSGALSIACVLLLNGIYYSAICQVSMETLLSDYVMAGSGGRARWRRGLDPGSRHLCLSAQMQILKPRSQRTGQLRRSALGLKAHRIELALLNVCKF